ncbi:MAG: hypothetical protein EXQ96_04020 [Alphaproteobacteria bacterium]|nr:hypothetical protein [Alphaproteobacteria bacterium]
MTHRVFFAFHYDRDLPRVRQISTQMTGIDCVTAAGLTDASTFAAAKAEGEAAVKALIDRAAGDTTVTVICIGAETARQADISYAIAQTLKRRNGMLGLQVHALPGADGQPDKAGPGIGMLENLGYAVIPYSTPEALAQAIETAAKAIGR